MSEPKLSVVHYSPVWLEITQTWLYNQLKYLPADIDNHIVCRSTRNLKQFALDNIHCLKRDSRAHYFFSKALWALGFRRYNGFMEKWVDALKPDVIHSHFGNNGWMNLEIAKSRDLAHVVTFYGQDVSMLPKKDPAWLERYRQLFDAGNTRFLCEGSHMAQCLVKMGCDPDQVKLHRLGVETDRIAYQPRQWRRDEVFKVLIAGSFREKKGIPYALEALAKLKDDLPLQITVIGDAGSQAEKARILEVIERHGLGEKIRLLGYQPHPVFFAEAYAHHLFLSPSVTAASGDTEGGAPVSIIEMAAAGMPIVSSFHCDIPELIRHGETGWLAPERDVDAIVACIRHWLERPEDWRKMLDAGRRHIETEYDVIRQSAKLAGHYRELADGT
ncbi:MAG: glycosyltransferase [Methylococcaceae bacterium]|nr:glycosyltransferase [Methylococcaceae bacterium]